MEKPAVSSKPTGSIRRIFRSNWGILTILIVAVAAVFAAYQAVTILFISDTVELANDNGEVNGVLVDGMKNGSFHNDDIFKGPSGKALHVGNYTAPPGEIIAFTKGRAPTVLSDSQSETVPFWTPATDTKKFRFEDEYVIGVHFWIITGPFEQQRKRALRAYSKTLYIWSKERQGIRLDGFHIEDRTTDQDADIILLRSRENPPTLQCEDVGVLVANGRYVPNTINIYYGAKVVADDRRKDDRPAIGPQYGAKCSDYTDLPGVFILMGDNTNRGLLAHELGHALGLYHIDSFSDTADPPQPYFNQKNVMHSASSKTRNFLTEGQTFRAVVQDGSALNKIYNARLDPLIKRRCKDEVGPDPTDPHGCPPVDTRIWVDH